MLGSPALDCSEPASLTFQHRASVRLYTSSYEFAQSCVFDKQSPGPFLCALSLRRRAPLLRTYGVRLPSSLTTILSSALGYSPRLPVSVLVRSYAGLFLETGPSNSQNPGLLPLREHPSDRVLELSDPSPSAGAGILTCFPSATPFGLTLGFRLSLGGRTFPRKP